MKFVFCRKCRDMVRLTDDTKRCLCGMSGGRYVDDVSAEFFGEWAVPVGIYNQDVLYAEREANHCVPVRAFVYSLDNPTCRKVEAPNEESPGSSSPRSAPCCSTSPSSTAA